MPAGSVISTSNCISHYLAEMAWLWSRVGWQYSDTDLGTGAPPAGLGDGPCPLCARQRSSNFPQDCSPVVIHAGSRHKVAESTLCRHSLALGVGGDGIEMRIN